MTQASGFSFGVVLLGAGASRRMGRCKLLLEWGGGTIAAHWRELWSQLGAAQLAIVLRDLPELRQHLQELGWGPENWIENRNPELGMFESIRCAARWPGWHAAWTHFAICLGDQPHVRRQTHRDLLRCAAAHPQNICQPEFEGRPKHPVVLPREIFLELGSAREETLKAFLQGRDNLRLLMKAEDPGLALDIDTPEDYQRVCPRSKGSL